MNRWLDKLRKSINPEDDDNTFDDDELTDEDDFAGRNGYNNNDFGAGDIPMGGNGFNHQQNQVYTHSTPNVNNFQQPANNPPPPSTTTSVTTITGDMRGSGVEIKMIKPETYPNDGARIADLLMARKTVIVNFEETKKEVAIKLLDFMTGLAYATRSQINKTGEKNYIMTPPGSAYSEDVRRTTERGRGDSSIY